MNSTARIADTAISQCFRRSYAALLLVIGAGLVVGGVMLEASRVADSPVRPRGLAAKPSNQLCIQAKNCLTKHWSRKT